MGTGLIRGRVYRAKLNHIDEPKSYLVVSNNRRNEAFNQVLTVRLTTTRPRSPRPAMVELGAGEVFTGWASCDDVETLWPDEVQQDLGAVLPVTMRRVEDGLRAALDLGR
jgi:mRNA-degrading endonuclease toxin of MazEF toxin-antitoxin module